MGDEEDRPASRRRAIGVELIQDMSSTSLPLTGFLRRHRHRAKTLLEGGRRTDTYIVDFVDREPNRRDAVAVAVYVASPPDTAFDEALVLLRRQMRYPVFMVSKDPLFMEVVAGIIESDESPVATAVRELYEETGIEVDLSAARTMGAPFFASPGVLTERVYPVAIPVPRDTIDQSILRIPGGDGSPMEEGAELVVISLAKALELTEKAPDEREDGIYLADAKTEIVLRRLHETLKEQHP